MDDATASMNYAIDEAAAFLERHPDANSNPMGGTAALAFGFLRALYESPCHPGVSMNPVPADWLDETMPPGDWWYCPECGLAYRYRSDEEIAAEQPQPKRRKRRIA